jgi:dihydrodipicolinate synthase/N-acetylneuraminate lyase
MKQALIAVIVVFGFATPALAAHCPKDGKKIEQSLASNDNAEARALMEQGMALHNSGKHKESIEALHQAMQILGIEH